MIEWTMSWICLFVGVVTQNANYLIASGVYAIALQIYLHRKGGAE